jgi:hypothetical protein
MSTLKVTNIQDTSGGNNSTSEEIFEGRCKAWLQLDANSSSPSIQNDFNINSVSYTNTGRYVVNFSNALSGGTYCVVTSASRANGDSLDGVAWPTVNTRTSSSFNLQVTYTNNNFSSSSSYNNLTPILGVVVFD